MMLSRFISLSTVAFVLACPIPIYAQDPVFDAKGFQQNRDYFSQESYEHIDTLSGSLVLTFTDLALPGNAGHDLQFQRTYNSKGKFPSPWTFGIAGMVMRVFDPGPPPLGIDPPESARGPKLITTAGAEEPTTWLNHPLGNDLTSYRWVITTHFRKYDRTDRALYFPDGTIAHYDAQGRLIDSSDTFGNTVTLVWDPPGSLRVIQSLGAGQQREVTFVMDDASFLPSSMTFAGRQWTYGYDPSDIGPLMKRAQAPVGPAWDYTYDGTTAELTSVRNPSGGIIQYEYGTREFDRQTAKGQIAHSVSRVVTKRTRGGRDVIAGEWTYEYSGNSVQRVTVIVGPPGPSQTRTTYVHEPVISDGSRTSSDVLDGGLAVKGVTVESLQTGSVVEQEQRDYRILPVANWSAQVEGTVELSRQTTNRTGRVYATEYLFHDTSFADYHRPYQIVETGELARTTTRAFDYGFAFYSTGKVGIETVTVNGESFTKSWGYNRTTGFLETENDYDITTSFAPDAFGNVASVSKGNGKATTSTYEWGVVKEIHTPEYVVSRSINPEGTVASETRAGRLTSFGYDDLFRITTTQPPGGTAPIITSYDNAGGAWVRVTRGSSITTTTVDGFGKPIGTTNSVGVQTRTRYDAEGRKTYEGYPFGPGLPDIGATIQYDGLGRVVRRTNPDGTYIQNTYGDGTVAIRDENGHVTTQTRQAFGNPDEARLAAVTDATGQTWQYGYNALGKLTTVMAPADPNGEPIQRTWHYNAKNLLDYETQPESGTTGYDYDAAGVLAHRTDAKGVRFTYQYDGNDRVRSIEGGGQTTTVTYEPGSENRQTVTVNGVVSQFTYDSAGQLHARTDTIDGRGYIRLFDYDNDDNLRQITYPSGRRVTYDYDAASRITKVRDATGARDVASNFTYHPSGAVTAYTSGNGIVNEMTFDAQRYWPRSISAGALQLTYDNYDGVSNIQAIGDSRSGMGQTFGYDALDRLTAASGPYGGITYAYDAHGNRSGNEYEYWSGTLRIKAQNGSPFGYDPNGNLTSTTNGTFTYTPDNMMETSVGPGGSASYRYDADGWRAKKESGGSVSFFLRGLHGELLTELRDPNTAGAATRDYIYAGSRLLAVISVP